LKVGTTTESAGRSAPACAGSAPDLMASFMREAYIRRVLPCQAAGNYGVTGQGAKIRKKRPKMLTTTNNKRAYIRRCLAIAWSSRRRSSGESIDGALETHMGTTKPFRKGLWFLVRDLANDGPLCRRRSGGRGRRSRRRGRRPGWLPELSDRPVDHGHGQHDRRNDPAQDTRHRLRCHIDRPLDCAPRKRYHGSAGDGKWFAPLRVHR